MKENKRILESIFIKIEKFVPQKWKWILSHEGFRRYFANTGWMFFGQMFGLLVSFFVGIWMARYLGPENFGILNYSMAFVGLFAFIANFGVDHILSRELIKFPEKRDELLGTAFKLKFGGGILAFFITVVAIFFVDNSFLIRCLVILYALTFIFQSINVVSIFFQAKVAAKKNVQAQIISSSISSVFKIIIILLGFGVFWLMLVYVLDFVWLGIILISTYRRFGLKIKNWSFNKPIAKQMFSSSWLLMLTSVFTSIYMRIDQIIIKNMINETALGLYSAAIKLSEIWYFIPVIICSSLFPAIVNSKKINHEIYFSRLKKLFLFMLFLSLTIAITITFLAKPIISLLFGIAYIGSVSVLSIYVWSIVGTFLNVAIGSYLVAENYIKIYFFINLIGAVSNIILNLLLIPRMGIDGAALATVFSYSLIILSLFFFKNSRKDLLKIIF